MPHTEIRTPEGASRDDWHRYQLPPVDDGESRLYALLAVEVKPGHIAYFHLELDHTPGACTITMDREEEPDVVGLLDSLRYRAAAPIHIQASISGTCVSQEQDYRPPARTEATVGRALSSGNGDAA
jgi:hypothetical protein